MVDRYESGFAGFRIFAEHNLTQIMNLFPSPRVLI
jgi:hypothetical protein